MNPYWNRIVQAIKLDSQIYEEVEADTGALGQALGVVVMASLASGIASLTRGVPASLIGDTLGALIGWFAWSYLILIIGTRWMAEPQTQSDYGELLRTIGFASAPGLLAIVGIIPGLYTITFLVVRVWILVATVIAVRQALDFRSTGRAIIVCLIGWIIFIIINIIIGSIFA